MRSDNKGLLKKPVSIILGLFILIAMANNGLGVPAPSVICLASDGGIVVEAAHKKSGITSNTTTCQSVRPAPLESDVKYLANCVDIPLIDASPLSLSNSSPTKPVFPDLQTVSVSLNIYLDTFRKASSSSFRQYSSVFNSSLMSLRTTILLV